jgi:uncharacterized protein
MTKNPQDKATLVLGASDSPERVSYTAIHMLREEGIPVYAVGLVEADVAGVQIRKGVDWLEGKDVHTVTMYMRAQRQREFEPFLLRLNPKRIIFNPGAENPELYRAATQQGIECKNACTLVMLNFGQF